MPTRRQVLKQATVVVGGSALSGCRLFLGPRPLEAVCPRGRSVSYLPGPLTIDAHCHVFNGTDLQVGAFLALVQAQQKGPLGEVVRAVADLLQNLVWTVAPSGAEELPEVRRLASELEGCTDTSRRQVLTTLRDQGYRRGRQELQAAVQRTESTRRFRRPNRGALDTRTLDRRSGLQFEFVKQVEDLPDTQEAFRNDGEDLLRRSLSARAVRGLVDYLVQNFQYRYVNAHDYLRTYNHPGSRVVDLMVPSLVDYDWPLASGVATATSRLTQIELMGEIAIATGGRVHALAPFDPLREVAFRRGLAAEGSLELVKLAVEKHGCAGVKLYPPMGFAAFGNASKPPDFWRRSWLPTWMSESTIGTELDDAMAGLLSYCQSADVPVMAHANVSNGPASDFEELAGPAGWALALAKYPTLRVSFGHFGGAPTVTESLERARAFTALMKDGRFAFADAGFYVEVVGRNSTALLEALEQLYQETVEQGDAALANRFMYGTDWLMTLTDGGVDRYLDRFIDLFEKLEQQPSFRRARVQSLTQKFLGVNAVLWLGLRRGDATRTRLEQFYADHGVPTPDWARKVDDNKA